MMGNEMNRRDFLKLLSMGAAGRIFPRIVNFPGLLGNPNSLPNILVLVFDTWSAENVSFYGYERETMPNLTQLLDKAIVFHNHYSSSNFTTPGTASILTGRYSWSHGAIYGGGKLDPATSDQNFFHSLKDDYFQVAYTHNGWADFLIKQAKKDINQYIYRSKLYLDNDLIFDRLLSNDLDVSIFAKLLSLFNSTHVFQSSLILQRIHLALRKNTFEYWDGLFPRGLPKMGNSESRFVLEDGIDWLVENLNSLPKPYIGYFHFFPPHHPYNTRVEFVDQFKNDDYKPIKKPIHKLSAGIDQATMDENRQLYDEFMLYVDAEIGRLFEHLESQGVLDDLWIFLTSDHGEYFERGELYHTTKMLYQPVIHVPLMVFLPKNTQRFDVYSPTSATDLLPTILQLAGKEIPEWSHGSPLPLDGSNGDFDREVYSLQMPPYSRKNPLKLATMTMVKDHYKAMKSVGYSELKGKPLMEVYDLAADPEELDDLMISQPELAQKFAEILENKFEEINRNLGSK
jgi:arylsulfatase A-like enzyme